MPDAQSVFDLISHRTRVAVPVSNIAERFDINPDDDAKLSELGAALADLVASNMITLWGIPEGQARQFGSPGAVVTLTAMAAERLGLKLNRGSSRWIPAQANERNDRIPIRRTADGTLVFCEANLNSKNGLASIPAPEPEDWPDLDHSSRRIIAEESNLGLRRPTLVLLGIKPWVAGYGDRPPGAHEVRPEDNPRNDPDRDIPSPGVRITRTSCPVCCGRELRSMVSLSSVRVGKSRAVQPANIVEGGEFCGRCQSHWQDKNWPNVRPINKAVNPPGKVATQKGRGGGGGRKRGRGKAGGTGGTGGGA